MLEVDFISILCVCEMFSRMLSGQQWLNHWIAFFFHFNAVQPNYL